ncbi:MULTISPECIES: hypothetical protein [Halomicrobium]|nr:MULTISPECIES: hypothetical protein [Halomicrobium]
MIETDSAGPATGLGPVASARVETVERSARTQRRYEHGWGVARCR